MQTPSIKSFQSSSTKSMESHLVNKVSRFFPSSFTSSCKLTSVPDVVESSIPITKTKAKIFPHNPIIHDPKDLPNEPKSSLYKNGKKVIARHCKQSPLSGTEGRRCPPVTPLSARKKEKVKESTRNNVKSSSSNSGRWFSSTTDGEEAGGGFDGKSDAFFSLSSSCSSESFRRKRAQIRTTSSSSWRKYDINKAIFNDLGSRCPSALSVHSVSTVPENQDTLPSYKAKTVEKYPGKFVKGCEVAEDLTEIYYGSRKTGKPRRKRARKEKRRKEEMRGGDDDDDEFVVEESYAVEKNSNDPYGDFRKSMVEMIIEKQIFGAKDLEKLLDCFLSLNSSYYHSIIVQVFIEICDILFAT